MIPCHLKKKIKNLVALALWKKDEINAKWQLASCSATEFESCIVDLSIYLFIFISHAEYLKLAIPSTESWVTVQSFSSSQCQ